MHAGSGLELFSAVFEPQADSAWLKCLILKFCLIAQSSLHEASATLSESESSVPHTSGQTQYTDSGSLPQKALQPTVNSRMPSNNKAVNKKQKHKQTSRASAAKAPDSPSSSTRSIAASRPQPVSASQAQEPVQPARHINNKMAVPAASDEHKAAVNGFSGRGALDAASSGEFQALPSSSNLTKSFDCQQQCSGSACFHCILNQRMMHLVAMQCTGSKLQSKCFAMIAISLNWCITHNCHKDTLSLLY